MVLYTRSFQNLPAASGYAAKVYYIFLFIGQLGTFNDRGSVRAFAVSVMAFTICIEKSVRVFTFSVRGGVRGNVRVCPKSIRVGV